MKFKTYGHRHADHLFANLDEYSTLWAEIQEALTAITDEMIVEEFEGEARKAKSISQAINRLIKKQLTDRGWASESYIFADEVYGANAKGTWRLDFAKDALSVEVAFNHRSDISWNLIKPTLASELNHVQKAIQTSGGVIITATQEMKTAGGFDSAIGTFEDYVQYCKPLYGMLPTPLMIVGLEAPEEFEICVEFTGVGGNKAGNVIHYATETLDGLRACPNCGSILEESTAVCPECEARLTDKQE
ncbi:MAG: hypothetical protein Q4E12_00970 [Coriobacteriia bacterium]|nr:hypothetical protein [Coriobacteriia bacterium]